MTFCTIHKCLAVEHFNRKAGSPSILALPSRLNIDGCIHHNYVQKGALFYRSPANENFTSSIYPSSDKATVKPTHTLLRKSHFLAATGYNVIFYAIWQFLVNFVLSRLLRGSEEQAKMRHFHIYPRQNIYCNCPNYSDLSCCKGGGS